MNIKKKKKYRKNKRKVYIPPKKKLKDDVKYLNEKYNNMPQKNYSFKEYTQMLHNIDDQYLLDLIIAEDGDKINSIAPNFKPYNVACNIKRTRKNKMTKKQKQVMVDIYAKYLAKNDIKL